MDAWAVRAAAGRDRSAASAAGPGRSSSRRRTYRFVGHSRSDPGKYRPEGELDQWKQRDPLLLAASRLTDELRAGRGGRGCHS